MHHRLKVIAVAAASLAISTASASQLDILIRNGDPVPGGTLRLLSTQPVFSGPRVVSFHAGTSSPTLDALFTLSGPQFGTVRRVMHEEQPTPAGDGRVRSIEHWSIASDGNAYVATALENVTQYGARAIYRVTPTGAVTELVRNGKPLAAGLPALCDTAAYSSDNLYWRQSGSLLSNFNTVDGSGCTRSAIWQVTPNGNVSQTVALGTPVLGTSETLTQIFEGTRPSVLGSEDNTLLFAGRDSSAGTTRWYLRSGTGLRRIVNYRTTDDRFASRNGTLTLHNDSTHTVSQYVNGSATPAVIFARGQAVPGGDGQFYSFNMVDVSESGHVLLVAQLTGTPNGTGDDTGVYFADARGIVEIAREGRPGPVAGSIFTNFGNNACCGSSATVIPGVNDQGKALFGGQYVVSGQAGTRTAIYHYARKTGLSEVLNSQTLASNGSTTRNWTIGHGITDSAEVPLSLVLDQGGLRAIGLLRLDSLFASGIE